MKILVTSDLHGNLPYITEPFDLLLICGDICPAHDHYFSFQNEWIKNEFCEWVNNLPFKNVWSKVVLTWGNHDMAAERYKEADKWVLRDKTNGRLVTLKNETYDFDYLTDEGVKTLKIFGTPYCKIFGNWAFMVSDEKLEKKYSECPMDVDIFISHDSPTTNGLGMINEGYSKGVDAGSHVLDTYIADRKPKFFFSGHIHTGNHRYEKVGDTGMANVSYINERYNPVYPLLVLDMEGDEVKDSYLDCETLEGY